MVVSPEAITALSGDLSEDLLKEHSATKEEEMMLRLQGNPHLASLIERHYDGWAAKKSRSSSDYRVPIITETAFLHTDTGEMVRVRVTTYPKTKTDVTLIGEEEERAVM